MPGAVRDTARHGTKGLLGGLPRAGAEEDGLEVCEAYDESTDFNSDSRAGQGVHVAMW